MSLASVYAASQASADAGKATATAGVPTPFVGPNGRADVSPTGTLILSPSSAGGAIEISAVGALAFRDWLTATFG